MPPEPTARRFRRLRIAAVSLLTLVVAAVGLLQLPPVATWLVRRLVHFVPLNRGYHLVVGRATGDWFGRLALEDVALGLDGREVLHVKRLGVWYNLRDLTGTPRRLRELDMEGARATARRGAHGWDLANALQKSADTSSGGGFEVGVIDVRDVGLVAQLSPDSVVRVRGLSMLVHDFAITSSTTGKIDRLNLAIAPPASATWFAVSARGAVSADLYTFDPVRIQTERSDLAGRIVLSRRLDDSGILDRLDLRLEATPLALADISPMVPTVASEGSMELTATASAQGRVVKARLNAAVGEGTFALTGSTELDGAKPTGLRMHGTVRRLDPSRLWADAPAGRVSGTADADLRGFPDSAAGTADVHLADSRLGSTSVERLDVHTEIANGRTEVRLRGSAGQGRVALDGWITPFDSLPGYGFSGSAGGMPGTAVAARTLSGAEADSVLDVRFRFAGRGLSTAARLRGRLDFAVVGRGGERLALGGTTLSLEGGRLFAVPDLSIGGGQVSAVATARLGDTVTYRVSHGSIAGVDLGRLMGDTLAAPLNGRFSLAGSGTTPADAVAEAHLMLEELRYGDRRVNGIRAAARLDKGRATFALRGALQGGRVAADVSARPFDSTPSFQLTRASLESVDVGELIGRPDLAGPVTLRGEGAGRWSERARQVKGEVSIEPSRLGHVSVSSGTIKAVLDGQRLTYEASVNTNGGALSVVGDGRPLAESPVYSVRTGRADSLDLGALLGRAGLESDINATFTATLAGAGDSADATIDLTLLPSTVNDAALSGGRLAASMRHRNVNGRLTLESPDGRVGARIDGVVAPGATTLHTEGTIVLEHLARWTGRKEADGRIEGEYSFDAAADSAGLRSIGGTASAIGGVGQVRVLGARLVLTPVNGTVKVDTLRIRSNVAQLDGAGTIALREGVAPGRFRIGGRFADVEPIATLTGGDTVSLDSAAIAMELAGPAYRWTFEGHGRARSVLYAGNLAEEVAFASNGAIDSTGLRGIRGEIQFHDAAYGRVAIPEVKVAARYDSVVALDASASVGDNIRLITSVRGAVIGNAIHAVVQRLDLRESSRDWALERPANVEIGSRIKVDRLALASGDRRITIQGTFDPGDSSDLSLAIQGVDLDGFRSAGLVPVGGRIDGDFHLSGRAAAPTLQGKVGLAIVDARGKTSGRIGADLLWRHAGLRISAVAAPISGGKLTLDGTLPYRLTLTPADTSRAYGVEPGEVDTLGIAVAADSFNLALFQPLLPADVAGDLGGALTANGHVRGRLQAPEASGTLALTGGTLTLPALGVSYSRGELAARLDGEDLHVEHLRLMTGKNHELDGQGTIHLKPLTNPGLDLSARLKDFRISESPALNSSASGEIQLAGTVSMPSVTGSLELGPTDVFVGGQAAAKVEKVKLTPQEMRRLARDFGPAVLSHAEEGSSLMDRARLDLQLRLPRRVWIRKRQPPEADIELTGRMRLKQEPGGDMQFVGKVEPVPGRGALNLSGRTFRLTGGEINLNGPIDSTRMDVTAEYQVPTQGGGEDPGVVITVEAKGRLDSLGLEFSSEPTMGQEDVLSYIVTGHPASDNPLESSGQAFSGKQIAFGQLSQALSGTAGKQLGFDVFQIKTDPTSGLSLTAGRYLSSRFFLNLKLPLGRGSSSVPGDNLGPGFELEYTARRWLRANLRGGSLPPAILFRGRHAY